VASLKELARHTRDLSCALSRASRRCDVIARFTADAGAATTTSTTTATINAAASTTAAFGFNELGLVTVHERAASFAMRPATFGSKLALLPLAPRQLVLLASTGALAAFVAVVCCRPLLPIPVTFMSVVAVFNFVVIVVLDLVIGVCVCLRRSRQSRVSCATSFCSSTSTITSSSTSTRVASTSTCTSTGTTTTSDVYRDSGPLEK
jgi:hypothetical protein